ncbi:DUF2637 domain-containing protein [Kitasatospora sp. NPDC001660]
MTTATAIDSAPATVPTARPSDDISGATGPVSEAARTVSAPGWTVSDRARRGLVIAFVILTALGGAVLAVVGFAGSYSALRHLAVKHEFGWFSPYFPIGVDVGIVVLYALDLAMIRIRRPLPLLRFAAHVFTLATIVFNAGSGGPVTADPLGAMMHAIIPCCFLLSVEAVRHFLTGWVEREAGEQRPKVPLYRWILSPWRTWALYRRMRLWEMPSYEATVAAEQDRTVYRAMLRRDYGRGWRRKAPADLRLPIDMARYGLTVDKALELPEQREEAAAAREQAKKERELQRMARDEVMEADAQIASMRTAKKIAGAQIAIETEHDIIQAQAEADRVEAAGRVAVKRLRADFDRRAAEQEEQRLAQVAADEAAAKESEAAAETRKAAAEKLKAAAKAEADAAEIRDRAAEAKLREAQNTKEAAEAARQAAELKLAAAKDAQTAAEIQEAAAKTRSRAAEIELRAIETEDLAKLTPRQRAVRKVARMILKEAGGVPEHLPLQTIEDECRVSNGTASEYRTEAAELLAEGYRPAPEQVAEARTVAVIPQPHQLRDNQLTA